MRKIIQDNLQNHDNRGRAFNLVKGSGIGLKTRWRDWKPPTGIILNLNCKTGMMADFPSVLKFLYRVPHDAWMKILVVDDESPARRKLLSLLRTNLCGKDICRKTENLRGRKINQLEAGSVLLDIQMPGKSGFEVIAEVGVNSCRRSFYNRV